MSRDGALDLVQKGSRRLTLHGGSESGIIPRALQMRLLVRWALRPWRAWLAIAAMLSVGAQHGWALDSDDPASTRTEIMRMLHEVQSKYGSDAVMIEGHLLGQTIEGGSILEAVVSVPGVEERDGKKFLTFKVETGIIYNDHETDAPVRTVKAWRDIVEATLRKFRTLSLPADGIVVVLSYAHKTYGDEADLRAHLHEGHGTAEEAAFYLLLSDVSELMAERISPQQLLDRSTVLLNGARVQLVLDPKPPQP